MRDREGPGPGREDEIRALRERVARLEGIVSDVGTILEGFDRLASAFSSCVWVYEVEENRFTYDSPSSEQVWERSRESLYADSWAKASAAPPLTADTER